MARRTTCTFCLAALLWQVGLASAGAEDWHWRRGARSDLERERGGVAGELAMGTAGSDGFTLSPMVGGWLGVGDHGLLSLDWGALFARDGKVVRNIANPLLTGLYVVETEGVRVEVGLQVSPPAAQADTLDEVDAGELAAFLRGGWNAWMWFPEFMGFAAPVHAESLRENVHLALDITFAGMVAPSAPDAHAFVAQAAVEGGYRDDWGAAGLRMPLVWMTFNEGGDFLQSSLEPFVRVTMGDGFLTMRSTINLDEPFGLAGDGARVWALHIGAGTVL
ncbi:MAG: hypothetical protein ACOCXM_05080 [Myxococcota bacterium]